MTLSVHKEQRDLEGVKGHTVFVFDDSDTERSAFVPLVLDPPAWTDSFYGRDEKRERLDKVIDVPYFADSKHVGLLQVADLFAYLLRNYAEVAAEQRAPKYHDELEKLTRWAKAISSVAFPRSSRWPAKPTCECSAFFNSVAPDPLKDLK